jgi:hypothetical protein
VAMSRRIQERTRAGREAGTGAARGPPGQPVGLTAFSGVRFQCDRRCRSVRPLAMLNGSAGLGTCSR